MNNTATVKAMSISMLPAFMLDVTGGDIIIGIDEII
jgi:hypothetical protein